MSLTQSLLLIAAGAYVAALFAVAFWADREARRGRRSWLNSPLIYTLSLSVYCTSWTFYGAVGSAARNGLEFMAIYVGPTLVFIGWWALMRRLVRVGRARRTTSIADFLSARYGKSPALAALVTIAAVVAVLPYIALQLKAVASSLQIIAGGAADGLTAPASGSGQDRTALWLAAGMAAFAILFGTRNLEANERHHGVVAAIAVEAIVKLAALIAVGVFALYSVADGVPDAFAEAPAHLTDAAAAFDARWATLTFLSAAAMLCLPRMFQVTVVECVDERHGRVAAWMFPTYLLLISLFVAPIAAVGLKVLPEGADPDLFVLTLPLAHGADGLALLAFLGGFSSATSMVIVSCLALATMVSNHLILPFVLKRDARPGESVETTLGDVREYLLRARRVTIIGIMLLSFLYHRLADGGEPLASIGLTSFVGVAQFLPALVAALYWRRATARGALAGLATGFTVWALTLFAPNLWPHPLWDMLAPPDLGYDALVSATFWSLGINVLVMVSVSLSDEGSPMERMQAASFANATEGATDPDLGPYRRTAASRDLYAVAERILGGADAHRLFDEHRRRQGAATALPAADDALISTLERRLAGTVGAASAHAMVSKVATGAPPTLAELMLIADETARLVDHSQQLESKSRQLESAAQALREANRRLQALDAQKDEFLVQVSHELRTPMTSLRAFSEILRDGETLSPDRVRRFADIMHRESLRLTRLLDQILDLGQMEHGQLTLNAALQDPERVLDRAVEASLPFAEARGVAIDRMRAPSAPRLEIDADRMQQVFMNVLSNSLKYNTAPEPKIWLSTHHGPRAFDVIVSDNGPGVPADQRARIFEKFARAPADGGERAKGVGLGLAISRRIMALHGGEIELIASERGGASFRIRLPAPHPQDRRSQAGDRAAKTAAEGEDPPPQAPARAAPAAPSPPPEHAARREGSNAFVDAAAAEGAARNAPDAEPPDGRLSDATSEEVARK